MIQTRIIRQCIDSEVGNDTTVALPDDDRRGVEWAMQPMSGAGPASPTRPGGAARSYPRLSHLLLGASPSAVPCARLHARQVAWEWGLAAVADSVELAVSELVTNAVRACEGLTDSQHGPATVQMWLSANHHRVLIQVWDPSEQLPQWREPDPAADRGRGLAIVAAISKATGAYRLEGQHGKIVWALVERAATGARNAAAAPGDRPA